MPGSLLRILPCRTATSMLWWRELWLTGIIRLPKSYHPLAEYHEMCLPAAGQKDDER